MLKLLFSTLTLSCLSYSMIVIDNYTANTNDRFTDNSNFILDSYDLSGIGQASNGRWATLIGPNTIISANHFRPSGDITFFPTNSGTSPVVIGLGSLSQRIGNTDLWLSSLNSFAPNNISAFQFDENGIVAPDLNAFLTGRGREAGAPSNQNQAFGTNETTLFLENIDVSTLGNFDVIFLEDDEPTDILAYTNNEALLQTGDSGAPLLIDTGNGELTLFGINSATGSFELGGENVSGNFINHTGQEATAINSFINAAINAVPEPSSTLLLSFGALSLLIRRKRL